MEEASRNPGMKFYVKSGMACCTSRVRKYSSPTGGFSPHVLLAILLSLAFIEAGRRAFCISCT